MERVRSVATAFAAASALLAQQPPDPGSEAAPLAKWADTVLSEARALRSSPDAQLSDHWLDELDQPLRAAVAHPRLLAGLQWDHVLTALDAIGEQVADDVDGTIPRRRVREAFRTVAAAGVVLPIAAAARWGELALIDHDLGDAVRALSHNPPAPRVAIDYYHRARLEVLRAHVQCRLGCLDRARVHPALAQRSIDAFLATRDKGTRQWRERVDSLAPRLQLSQLAASVEVRLLAGDHDAAIAVIEAAPAMPELRAYRCLARVLQGDLDAEAELEAMLTAGDLPAELIEPMAPKLVKAAIGRGALDVAERRLARLRSIRSRQLEPEGFATVELELALARPGPVSADAGLRAFESMLARWRQVPRMPGGIGFLQRDDRTGLLTNVVRAAMRQDPSGELALERVLAAHAAAALADEVLSGDRLRAEFTGEAHDLLILLPGPVVSQLLHVTSTGVTAHPLAPVTDLRAAVQRMIGALHDRIAGKDAPLGERDAAWLRATREVARQLLPAAVRDRLLRCRRLTVFGAGLLYNVPFAVLPLDDRDDSARLGERVAIEHVANAVRGAATPPAREQGPALLASAMRTETDTGRLPLPHAMIDRLLRGYGDGGLATERRLDDELLVPEILDLLERARSAHLVGHGASDWRRIYQHSIRFRDDVDEAVGVLHGDDVVGRDLGGLVVLMGSCKAGQVPWRLGGDPLAASLAGAMLDAGARCVILPTTDVHVASHFDAANRWHDARAAGAAPAEALLAARAGLFERGQVRGRIELLLMQLHGRGF